MWPPINIERDGGWRLLIHGLTYGRPSDQALSAHVWGNDCFLVAYHARRRGRIAKTSTSAASTQTRISAAANRSSTEPSNLAATGSQ